MQIKSLTQSGSEKSAYGNSVQAQNVYLLKNLFLGGMQRVHQGCLKMAKDSTSRGHQRQKS